jgi:hypothetical protein
MPNCSATFANGQPCNKAAKHAHEGRDLCGIHHRPYRVVQDFCTEVLESGAQCSRAAKHTHDGRRFCSFHKNVAKARDDQLMRQQAAVAAREAAVAHQHVNVQVHADEQLVRARAQHAETVALGRRRLQARDRVQARLVAARAALAIEEARIVRMERLLDEARARAVLDFNAVQMAIDARQEVAGHAQALQQVVFARDPVGDVDLRAFGQDNQSVHRSAIQNSTEAALAIVMTRPLHAGQNTMHEFAVELNKGEFQHRRQVFLELEQDIARNLEAFNHSYKNVLDHVWASIRNNVNKQELTKRLYEELLEGSRMCSNGKMCRLLTVLQGYDDQVVAVIGRDAFQSKFATLANLPFNAREAAALRTFNEYGIPEEERQVWLEPLLEA